MASEAIALSLPIPSSPLLPPTTVVAPCQAETRVGEEWTQYLLTGHHSCRAVALPMAELS